MCSALTRRDQPERASVTWVKGDLSARDGLRELVHGADAVIHVAGTISATTAAGFEEGNVTGTLAMLAAATAGGLHRFVHVSSLAAREPKLSLYGASKSRAEDLVRSSGFDWSIVRPPAVYGPGDKETLELFRMAKLGVMLMPPKGRLSVIHVDDLGRLLLALAAPSAPSKDLIEPDDGKPGGWTHRAFAQALARAVGTRAAVLSSPSLLLRLAARADQWLRGSNAKLTVGPRSLFRPPRLGRTSRSMPRRTRFGSRRSRPPKDCRETAAWYRAQGWL